MYLCLCNPFTDSDVETHLEHLNKPTRVASVYKACSGGEPMNCGSCACELKKMVNSHNSKHAVGQINKNLKKSLLKTKEVA